MDIEGFKAPRPSSREAQMRSGNDLSDRAASRVRQVESTRYRRQRQQQDIGFSSRPFTLCNLPIRPVKNRTVYERRNGNFFLRIEAGQGRELPYGRDRLVLILVTTMAVQQQCRTVKLGSATDILRLFGRGQSGTHYRKLMESFDRIFSATICWGTQRELENRSFIEQYKVSMLDHVRLWYCTTSHTHVAAFDNTITLSQPFFDELMAHSIPVDLEVVRGLLDSPGELDFYIWIVLRAWVMQQGITTEVPLCGPNSLREQLGTQVKADRKFRQVVRNWLRRTKAFWPDCPAEISSDGNALLMSHDREIHPSRFAVENPSFPRN